MSLSPEQGGTYVFELANGGAVTFRYEGQGNYLNPQWRDLSTGEVLATLPPYRSYKRID